MTSLQKRYSVQGTSLGDALARLPLPASAAWPDGVWDADVLAIPAAEVSVFAPRGRDHQTVHDRDELYVVVSGRGRFRADDVDRDFAAGELIFVPAGTRHRFARFSDDFVTWVVWLPTAPRDIRRRINDFAQAWLDGDVDRLMEYVTEDCVYVSTSGDEAGITYVGAPAVRTAYARYAGPRANLRIEACDPVVAEDRVFVEWSLFRRSDGQLSARGVDVFTLRGDRVCRQDVYRKLSTAETPPAAVRSGQ